MIYPWFKTLNHNDDYKKFVIQTIDNNKMTMGPFSYELERKIKEILNVKHVVLTTSGTSALMMATLALDIRPNDNVISTDYTWIATINPALILSSKLHTVDTIPNSLKVDFSLLNKKIKKIKPKLVYLVHLNGEALNNNEFKDLKKDLKFKVIEDTAQSLFSKNVENNYCGTEYEIGCFSLSITKMFNMIYGGFCVTNSDIIAEKLISIRNNGVNSEPENARLELAKTPGLNLKPNDLHAGIGIANLKNYERRIINSRELHTEYEKNLKDHPNLKLLKCNNLNLSIPLYNSVFVKDREKFKKFCEDKNIGIHLGNRGLHETKLFNYNADELINSINLSKHLIRLPSGPGYLKEDIQIICKKIINYNG